MWLTTDNCIGGVDWSEIVCTKSVLTCVLCKLNISCKGFSLKLLYIINRNNVN